MKITKIWHHTVTEIFFYRIYNLFLVTEGFMRGPIVNVCLIVKTGLLHCVGISDGTNKRACYPGEDMMMFMCR